MYRKDATSRIVLAVILATAGALRLYHLETPSLWWDEILVPLTSSHGLASMESLRMNYTAQAFRRPGRVRQQARLDEAVHVKRAPSGEAPGWQVITPEDAGKAGVVLADVEPAGGMVFYPRLSGPGDSIVVSEIGPDGSAEPVFMMRGGDEWTPISAQYPLDLGDRPGKRVLRFELRGRYAQLWVRDGQIFF